MEDLWLWTTGSPEAYGHIGFVYGYVCTAAAPGNIYGGAGMELSY